nr:hypothetical protein [Tanacetum cinerariifolium]
MGQVKAQGNNGLPKSIWPAPLWVQAKVLTEIEKLLPTHIPNAVVNYDPFNNREGKNKKKRRKDVGEPSSRSSRRNKSLVVIVQDDTPAMQPLDKADTLIQKHFNIECTEDKYNTSTTKHYAARYYKEGMSVVTEGNVYSDLRIKSVVRIVVKKKWGYGFLTSIVVRRSDDKEYEFSYADLPRLSVNDVEDIHLLQVQDKLHHPPLEFMKEFNNVLLMFTKRNMIKNRLSEVKKFCDGTLVKIQENLINMMSKNKLVSGNKRLKGRDWTDYDVKSLKEMLKKINKKLRHKE